MAASTAHGAAQAVGGHEGAAGPAAWAWVLLPLIPVAMALLGAPVRASLGIGEERRASFCNWWAVAACSATFALLVSLWAGGASLGAAGIAGVAGWGLQFSITPASLLFSLFSTWLWLLASLFSRSYLSRGHGHARYYFYFLLCLGGTLGTFLAANLLTLFVFFEIVSLGAYPLVVHEETGEAHASGRLYLYISIIGGLCVFLGTVLLHEYQLVAGALLLAGFGVKAGIVPVHIWLPRAHPVAPSPASALLSGVMIKTGAWGIYQVLRTVTGGGGGGLAAASGAGHSAAVAASKAMLLAQVLVPMAVTTMMLGAFLALFETNAKRVLAYSSVSQIGYVVLGAAMAGLLGDSEAMGAAGFAYHALAHALFKATMFFLVGVVYLKTHDLDIRRIGPLGRRLPVTAAVFALAVLGIGGFPGFSGYPSKTLLHDAILLLRERPGGAAFATVEIAFTITSALTVAYTSKLWYFLFLRKPGRRPVAVAEGHPAGEEGFRSQSAAEHAEPHESRGEKILALACSIPLLIAGLASGSVLSGLILPFAVATGYSHQALHHVEHLALFASEPLAAAAIPLAGGVIGFTALGLLRFPGPLLAGLPSIEGCVVRPLVALAGLFAQLFAGLDAAVNAAYRGLVRVGAKAANLVQTADSLVNRAFVDGPRGAFALARAVTSVDWAVDSAVNGSAQVGAGIARAFTIVDEGMDHLLVGSADAGMLAARACTVVDNTMDFIVVGSAPAAERAAVAVTKGNTFLEDGFVAASEGAALAVLRLAPDHRRRGAGKELGDKTTARYDRVTRLRAGPLSPSWTLGNLGFAVAVIAAFATFIIIAVAL